MLIKVRVPPGPARAEVMQLVDVFRARVVDVSEKTLTLAVTGDAGKVSHADRLKHIRACHSQQDRTRAMLNKGEAMKSAIVW